MSSYLIVALIVGVIVILGLGFYAGRLLFQLKQQNQRHASARNARIDTITESIETIAKAMEQQQCDLSEGAIRICNLLSALPLKQPPDYQARFPHIHTLFVEVSGFAILQDRQKLSKAEKQQQDKAREEIESSHESRVLPELSDIKAFCQSIRPAS
tara:strand:- start:537 stop:1004 length:468 start_codon:yes stop_codon:yes gene_type:complete